MQLTNLLSDSNFIDSLRKLGIAQGDVLQLHTSIFNFGSPIIPPKDYLTTLCKVLFDAVGESGTIAVPTFTYSFCDKKIFDVDKSVSKMGALNEFFRKNYAKRTKDANFSFAVWGEKSDYLLKADFIETFGENGIFARLKNLNTKVLDIGPTYDLTFFHFIERTANVSYRFNKIFKGTIKEGEKSYDSQNIYFCRKLNEPSRCDFKKIYEELKSNLKSYKEVEIAKTKMVIFDTNEVFDFCLKILKNNEKYFLIKD